MAWLRPILLLAGALFIAVLIWRERRRPRQAPEIASARTERSEPKMDPLAAPVVEPDTALRAERALPERSDTRDRDLHRAPPVIDWPQEEQAVSSPPSVASSDAAPSEPLPELIVDWPSEESRRIVTLRILPARQDRLAGRALRQGLAACGFRHGQSAGFPGSRDPQSG